MNGPSPEALEKLRAQTEGLLANAGRCPAGNRKLACLKIGGYSARKVVHWVETGEYPSDPIKPWCGDSLCVDCGRPGFEQPTAPEPTPSQPIAPPPPVPESHLRPVVDVEPLERVEPERQMAPLGPSGHGAPASFQSGSSVRSTVADVVRTVGIWMGAVVVLFWVCVVSVQGVQVGVSTVRKSLPDVHVETTSTTVVDGTTGTTG
jgi:hypothetical protein